MSDLSEERRYESLGPFEIKNKLIELASSHAERTLLNLLGIRNPIEALACLARGRSANPGFAALLEKAGNATPVVSFTVTYAVANVFLTLWGPIIVGVVSKNATP